MSLTQYVSLPTILPEEERDEFYKSCVYFFQFCVFELTDEEMQKRNSLNWASFLGERPRECNGQNM
jgi:hypothetical protein